MEMGIPGAFQTIAKQALAALLASDVDLLASRDGQLDSPSKASASKFLGK